MKRIILAVMVIAAIISITSCNSKNEDTLYEHGLDVIEKMDTLAESPEWPLPRRYGCWLR